MRSDARKCMEAKTARQVHPDPAVRELIARAWDDGYGSGRVDQALGGATTDNPYGAVTA